MKKIDLMQKREDARYPVTEVAKAIYKSWPSYLSHPEILSRMALECISKKPEKMVHDARSHNKTSYGFVGITDGAKEEIRNFCKKNKISITKFLSCVLEQSKVDGCCCIKPHLDSKRPK